MHNFVETHGLALIHSWAQTHDLTQTHNLAKTNNMAQTYKLAKMNTLAQTYPKSAPSSKPLCCLPKMRNDLPMLHAEVHLFAVCPSCGVISKIYKL